MTKENKKLTNKIILMVCIPFFCVIFYQNLVTFYGIKKNAGFVIGKVTECKGGRELYSYYNYYVNDNEYTGMQGGKRQVGSEVLIVYDTSKPRFSMIASLNRTEYNSNNQYMIIDTSSVDYRWTDYLPSDGSRIRSIWDFWLLD